MEYGPIIHANLVFNGNISTFKISTFNLTKLKPKRYYKVKVSQYYKVKLLSNFKNFAQGLRGYLIDCYIFQNFYF